MTPVVFVGIQPGSTQKSIRTLETWADRLGLKHYGFVNCISDPNERPSIRNVEWSFVSKCIEGSIPIALGELPGVVLKTIARNSGEPYWKLPHPSGLNRKLNDRSYVDKVLDHCQEFIVRRDLEMRVTKPTYTCAQCGKIEESDLTPEELEAQLSEEFPGYTLDDPHVVVCDDCYQMMFGTAH